MNRPTIKRSILINFSKKKNLEKNPLSWIRVHQLPPTETEEGSWNTRYKRWMEYWRAGGGRIYVGCDSVPFDDPHLRSWIEVWNKAGETKVFAYKDDSSDPEDFKTCSDLIDIFTYWITDTLIFQDRDKINNLISNW